MGVIEWTMNDVRRRVADLWADAANSWQDEMSRKYKAAVIDRIDDLLREIQSACTQLEQAREEALEKLKELQG